MSVFDEPKIDCHAHVLDPGRFPCDPAIAYHPSGQEIGTVGQMRDMMDCYGIRASFLVQPNSGYGGDNACMLDALASYPTLFRGAAILPLGAGRETLLEMKSRGVTGVAWNPTMLGAGFYAGGVAQMELLAELGMVLNLQVEGPQIDAFADRIREIPLRVLVDHVGRPVPEEGVGQAGFSTLLDLADTGRVWVKVSGYPKFSRQRYPFTDCWPYVAALKRAFTADRLLWASDWPYLRAPDRQDVGPLLLLAEKLFPEAEERRRLFWDTPQALIFG